MKSISNLPATVYELECPICSSSFVELLVSLDSEYTCSTCGFVDEIEFWPIQEYANVRIAVDGLDFYIEEDDE